MKVPVSVKIKTQIKDAATGKVDRESPWQFNLVMDQGLNGLARAATNGQQANPASLTANVLIGSGSTSNSVSSGAVTFTQIGTTLTASAGFFTAGMVGRLFKYGTGSGGAEYYITAFTNTTTVTVDTSATVAVPTVGTVWQVNQTALETFLFKSNTYQTNSGDNSTSFTSSTITLKRTIVFPVQGSPYTVNEIGYSPNPTGSNFICGRIVLSSSDVVGTTQFYVVVISVTFTYTPNTPAAVGNVGTNIDTSGAAMVEWFSVQSILSTGAASANGTSFLDGTNSVTLGIRITSTYTQQATIAAAQTLSWSGNNIRLSNPATWTNTGARGKMRATFTTSSASTTGQTMYGFGICINDTTASPAFDVLLTTPFTLPTGTFQPQTIFEVTYDRTLTN